MNITSWCTLYRDDGIRASRSRIRSPDRSNVAELSFLVSSLKFGLNVRSYFLPFLAGPVVDLELAIGISGRLVVIELHLAATATGLLECPLRALAAPDRRLPDPSRKHQRQEVRSKRRGAAERNACGRSFPDGHQMKHEGKGCRRPNPPSAIYPALRRLPRDAQAEIEGVVVGAGAHVALVAKVDWLASVRVVLAKKPNTAASRCGVAP